MKITYILILLLIIAGILIKSMMKNKKKQNNPGTNITTNPSTNRTTNQKESPENIYADLRLLALNATPEQLHLPIIDNRIYGIIMDWDVGEGIATLATFETGDASIYLSSGGGIIGGVGHENVKKAVTEFILLSQTYLDKTSKTDSTTLPEKGCVKFYLLTSNGKFVFQENMNNIENETSGWLPLFEEGNKVITELRIAGEKR